MKITNYFWEPLKIEQSDVWFWSDMHMGHKCEQWEVPLWKTRGFQSIVEHDEQLIARWNKTITPNSIVFHLGDIMFGMNGEERLTNLFYQLNFKTVYLLGGNHHAGFKQILNNSCSEAGVRFASFDYKKVYICPNYLEAIICGQPIVLSHYPLASWNGQAKGSWMIHGHCHSNLYKSEIGKILYRCKIIDVGIENSSQPKNFSELRKFFQSKTNDTFDHHNSETLNPL